nr:fibrobacter succinogenes major paralogous domain-containing protein [Bacteroidota bacterium]
MKRAFFLFTAIFFAMSEIFSQSGSITNIQVEQRTDGSGLVDVYFDLSGTEDAYFMNLRVSFDAGTNYYPVSLSSLSGDVASIGPGSRHIVWNPAIDHPNRYSPQTKIKLIAYAAGISNPCPGEPTVEDYDDNVYFTVMLGNQCWMASNLNTTRDAAGNQIPRYCYSNNTENCELYGGLYTWATVMNGAGSSGGNPSGVQGICPDGWHVPSDAEWTELTNYLINNYIDITSDNVGNKLKSCRQVSSPLGGECTTTVHPRWDQHSTHFGTNDYGFSALPGGFYNGISFSLLGSYGDWWSSTQYSSTNAWRRHMFYNFGSVYRSNPNKTNGFSVRCARD